MKQNVRKAAIFLVGLLLVSIFTIIGTVAFFGVEKTSFVRNVIITDILFAVMFVVWVKVNKNYETIYKSGIKHDVEHGREK
ncbi:MAG TPA: hypothetical protein VI934_02660 [Candidatus Nanoarchaeia archaeon]|nr:hypothetical protein [Candidatus Nanoarchaeia archaeon]